MHAYIRTHVYFFSSAVRIKAMCSDHAHLVWSIEWGVCACVCMYVCVCVHVCGLTRYLSMNEGIVCILTYLRRYIYENVDTRSYVYIHLASGYWPIKALVASSASKRIDLDIYVRVRVCSVYLCI